MIKIKNLEYADPYHPEWIDEAFECDSEEAKKLILDMYASFIEIQKRESEFRGRVISSFVNLEEGLDNLIATYFCSTKEKEIELIHTLLDDVLDVGKKIKICGFIIHKYKTRWSKKYLSVSDKMIKLNGVRKSMAHHIKAFTPSYVDKTKIHFFVYNTSDQTINTEFYVMDEPKLLRYEADCKEITGKLYLITKRLKSERASLSEPTRDQSSEVTSPMD